MSERAAIVGLVKVYGWRNKLPIPAVWCKLYAAFRRETKTRLPNKKSKIDYIQEQNKLTELHDIARKIL